jgi:ribonuclease HI
MKNKKIETYKVYCDGACEPNPGCGGYCSIIFKAGDIEPRVIITGGEKYTTNNRMEIMGVLSAFFLKIQIKKYQNVKLFQKYFVSLRSSLKLTSGKIDAKKHSQIFDNTSL